MSEKVVKYTGGIGFGGLLTILFIGLKLGHVIDWSWLWVLSPLWVPLAVFFAVGGMILAGAALMAVVAYFIASRGR